MQSPTALAVHGAAGRMGQAVLDACAERDDVRLVAALARLPDRAPARSGVVYTNELSSDAAPAVLVDFSTAAAFDRALALARERRIAFVSGTTGLDAVQRSALDAAAATIPVLWSANFSLGVALLMRLVAHAARALPDWDCEIAEAHHSRKRDAPSGTALALGRAVAAARELDFDAVARRSRSAAPAERVPGEIGFAVTRAADIVGEHCVLFATAGERIELVHRATDRALFARGALAAARWIADRAAGRYTLADVLDSR